MTPEPFSVLEIEWKTAKVFEISLQRNGLVFEPGDSVSIYAEKGDESRPYSITSGVDETVLKFLIQRMPQGHVSNFLSKLQSGDSIRLSSPYGWFHPGKDIEDDPFIFIATGTGIAPFLSYIRTYLKRPPEVCLYGVRWLKDAIDLDFLNKSCTTKLAISRESISPHHHGRVTDLVNQIRPKKKMHYYLCGLDEMIDEVSSSLEESGVDFSKIHREVFFYAPH